MKVICGGSSKKLGKRKKVAVYKYLKIQNVLPQSSGRPTFFLGINEISCSGSRVGVSGSFIDMISYHDFCPDQNTKFPKILRMDPEVFKLRISFRIKISGCLR